MLFGLFGVPLSPRKYLTLLGLVLIATVITRSCPMYRVPGLFDPSFLIGAPKTGQLAQCWRPRPRN
jgi:hypothetical protein